MDGAIRMHRRKGIAVDHRLALNFRAAVCVTLLGTAAAATWAAQGGPGWTVLQGSTPSWAKQANLAGPADPAGVVGFRVYLG